MDVDAVLNEMTSLSNEDLVFDEELEGTIVWGHFRLSPVIALKHIFSEAVFQVE